MAVGLRLKAAVARHAVTIGRAFGIPIVLDFSLVFVFGLITWTLAVSYYPNDFDTWPAGKTWLIAALTAAVFFFGILLHEFGHAAMARRFRMPVRRIVLFAFGGVVEIDGPAPNAGVDFSIAFAGPAVNLILAACFAVVRSLAGDPLLLVAARYLATVNLAFALFNLIPGYPLDGGRILRALLWRASRNLKRSTVTSARVGRGLAHITIVAGVALLVNRDFANALSVMFLGWFIDGAAAAELRQWTTRSGLATHPVLNAMDCKCAGVQAEISLRELADLETSPGEPPCFNVMQGDQPAGLLTRVTMRDFPRRAWARISAGQAMAPMAAMSFVKPDTEMQVALAALDNRGASQLPVVAEGRVVGLISRADILAYLQTAS